MALVQNLFESLNCHQGRFEGALGSSDCFISRGVDVSLSVSQTKGPPFLQDVVPNCNIPNTILAEGKGSLAKADSDLAVGMSSEIDSKSKTAQNRDKGKSPATTNPIESALGPMAMPTANAFTALQEVEEPSKDAGHPDFDNAGLPSATDLRAGAICCRALPYHCEILCVS
ncbi:hypothetical protein Nepgr_030094 [Nepenthes gracilis]|uniref:Uncharacterized protein n=1 Tax=Nepenthes gracilis TaxID=150966 RepID=A0AAD3TG46_NEPGR|nr:hypothetical protein Nepgr_030094 [Nepenthes gracilis]